MRKRASSQDFPWYADISKLLDGMGFGGKGVEFRICALAREYGLFREDESQFYDDIADLICKDLGIWWAPSTFRTNVLNIVSRYPKSYWSDIAQVSIFVIQYSMIYNKIQTVAFTETGMKLE